MLLCNLLGSALVFPNWNQWTTATTMQRCCRRCSPAEAACVWQIFLPSPKFARPPQTWPCGGRNHAPLHAQESVGERAIMQKRRALVRVIVVAESQSRCSLHDASAKAVNHALAFAAREPIQWCNVVVKIAPERFIIVYIALFLLVILTLEHSHKSKSWTHQTAKARNLLSLPQSHRSGWNNWLRLATILV